ncbi:ABC transporter permease subunit [Rhodovastum atsumiense]|uniref:ABC transporter permease subunit n=1 Tax=Rhodovastum atsumiense TaxID=504468 RepID=A0A5M6IUJ6_9PROT|nr:ABC transporter permease subunit [Rhodovastum atsumiense]KAA5611993.1 ABC transporter permease subunit [Rhodovastum atsumiense]CAH2598773.1 ABC transporter permease subunit [Rhodovastum atsumiense]
MSATAGISPASDQNVDVLIVDVPRPVPLLAIAGLAWFAVAALVLGLPNVQEVERTWLLAVLSASTGGVLLVLWAGGFIVPLLARTGRWAAWSLAIAVWLAAWELVTAKYDLLPLPFFASPQAFVEVYTDDAPRLLDCLWRSLLLLGKGYAIGAAVGFLSGVGLGWSTRIGYWVHPVLRLIGPLPATAWIPLAFFVFPTSGSASVFLIALATWFPTTVLTWSGVSAVQTAYYDVARTLGASQRFLVLKVAIPAALPHVFVGLFMGLGSSFAVLVVAEMLGVKSGLGWYLQWAQGWAAYANMYAALFIMAVMCSALITLLFRARDRLLAWQKGLVQW